MPCICVTVKNEFFLLFVSFLFSSFFLPSFTKEFSTNYAHTHTCSKFTGKLSITASWQKKPPYCGNLLLLGEREEERKWKKECLAFLITLLSFTLHPPYSLVALRRDVNLTVNAVRKWLVQEGQELEMGIRR